MSVPPAPKKLRRSEMTTPDDSVVCEEDETDSPFTLYFVKLPDANETETSNLECVFEDADNAGVMPEWITEEELEKVPLSDDFFVVPCFRGPLFRKMLRRELRIYGPPIVIECLQDQIPLPRWTHPIFSSVFHGAKISFTGMEPDMKKDLYEKVAWMNGVVGSSLYHESTHLVAAKAEMTAKYKTAVQNSIPLMRSEWIVDMWESSKNKLGTFSALDRNAVVSYSLKVFAGLQMTLTSIRQADRSSLVELIESGGGTVSGTMTRSKCTHLITDETTSEKYKKAVQWKSVKIVQVRWIRKCVDLGHLVEESKFHPSLLSVERMRSSTPKRDANMTETGPDISSIAGHGGRLSMTSFNTSSAIGPLNSTAISHPSSSGSSAIYTSKSFVGQTTISNDTFTVRRRSENGSTPIARMSTAPLIRYPTTQSATPTADTEDPIDEIRKQVDGLDDLFENCMFYVCGVEGSRVEKWRRFLDQTGATRVSKLESATNVVVVAPSAQEKMALRKYANRDDIAIVNVNWVVECVKKQRMVPHEEFEWTETQTEDSQSQPTPVISRQPSNNSIRTVLTAYSEPPPAQSKGIFATRTYSIDQSVEQSMADTLSEKISANGGVMIEDVEKAEFVVFCHSAPIHELISFDAVVSDLYIDTCLANSRRLRLSDHPLFVPLPRPPTPIFNLKAFYLHSKSRMLSDYVKAIIETNGGRVVDRIDSKSFVVVMDSGPIPAAASRQKTTVDLSWIVASVSKCRSQSIEAHLYREGTIPLSNYQRDDDVWMKSLREKEATQDMPDEEEDEDRNRVVTEIMHHERENRLTPLENPYFPDLKEPYKMSLKNLDNVHEIIDNMSSPSRESQDSSMTTSRIGSILRKAVINTGRSNPPSRNEPEPVIRPLSVLVAENRRTVSSTPVLQRNIERFVPIEDSFNEQNQSHVEELNRDYALHPHFLLSITDLPPKDQDRLKSLITSLGGIVEREFTRDVSILIAAKLTRTAKTLSSISAGKWCLTPEYIVESAAAGRFLEEEPFEWLPSKLERDASDIERHLVGVCRSWRLHVAHMPITPSVRMESRHNGAFTDWHCVVHEEDARAVQICSILEAGGAKISTVSEYIEVLGHSPTCVIASKTFQWNKQSGKMLYDARIPLYIVDVLYEYLIDRDSNKLSKYLHPNYPRHR